MRVPEHIIYILSPRRFLGERRRVGREFVADSSSGRGSSQIGGGHAKISWPNKLPTESRRLPDRFRWHPRCSFSRTSAFRLSPRLFEITVGKAHPSAFEKA